jgi:general secretion pathway protein N
MRVRRAEIAAFMAMLLIAGVALFPLSLAIPLFGLDTVVAARRAEGSMWNGRLYDAQIGGVPFGQAGVKLRLLPLFVGHVRVDLSNATGSGGVTRWPGGQGIDDVNANLAIGAVAGQIPFDRAIFEDVTIHFAGTHCARADGRLRLIMRYPLAEQQPAPVLSGTLKCDGDAVAVRLADAGGAVLLNLRLSSDGSYSGRLNGADLSMRVGGRL